MVQWNYRFILHIQGVSDPSVERENWRNEKNQWTTQMWQGTDPIYAEQMNPMIKKNVSFPIQSL